MPQDITDTSAPDFKIDSARNYPAVAKSNDELPGGPCRGLLVGVAGTANLTDLDDNDEDGVPLQAGYNYLACKKVRPGGDADNIRALY